MAQSNGSPPAGSPPAGSPPAESPPAGSPPAGYPPAGGTTTGGNATGTNTTGANTTGTTGTSTGPAPGSLAIHVIWTSDGATTPWTQQAATVGRIGGTCTIHVSFAKPPNAVDVTLTELRIHEDAFHYHDTLGSSNVGIGIPSSLCGDPANAPQMWYYDTGWYTTTMHNGTHTISAKLEYYVSDPNTHQKTGPFHENQQVHVDVENMLITSTNVNTSYNILTTITAPPAGAVSPGGSANTENPAPILWDPTTMSSVQLTATVTAAYRAYQSAILSIFDSHGNSIKTLKPPAHPDDPNNNTILIGPDSTPVELDWDGTTDSSGMGNMSANPMTGSLFGGGLLFPPTPGAYGPAPPAGKAPKGVYLYQFQVIGWGAGFGDYDTDKSILLKVTQADVALAGYDSSTNQNSFLEGCVLTDATGKPAASASVTTYDPNLLQISGPTPEDTITNLPDVQPSRWNEVTTPQAANGWGLYTHLFSALDNHASEDKGHRQRWALQKSALAGTVDLLPYYINKDDPSNSTWESLGGTPRVVYGGSQPSTSDTLALQAVVTDLGAGSPTYTWSIMGRGAVAYTPPPLFSATSVWNVGSIHATPGTLRFTCVVTWPSGYSASLYMDIEVGIRTDDAVLIGWINPDGVALNSDINGNPLGQPDDTIKFLFPPGGPTDPNFDALSCAQQLGLLSLPSDETITHFLAAEAQAANTASANSNGTSVPPAVPPPDPSSIQMDLTQPEKDYILNWLFKYTANPDPQQTFTGDLAAYEIDPTRYKLLNHFQVKYRVKDGQFNGSPTILKREAKIGSTHNPVAGIPVISFANPALLPGQAGPNDDAVLYDADNTRISHVNDGSPDARGVRSFIALEGMNTDNPKYWEDIGSKITFRCKYPWTTPQFIVQPYPTYYPYTNGVRGEPFPEATSPQKNFNAHPYPFGNGGRGGDGTQPAAPDAETPPYIQP